jgi:hypothetical protein
VIAISATDTPTRTSASVQLGGVTVYGQSEGEIVRTIDEISQILDDQGTRHLSATRPVLQKLVSDEIGEKIERRLFGAILGSRIRVGVFEAWLCEAEQGSEFRVFIHRSQVKRFKKALNDTLIMLRDEGEVLVKQIERTLFPARSYNTWSSTSHVLGRLVFQGKAEYLDKMTFRFPVGLQHALRDSYK